MERIVVLLGGEAPEKMERPEGGLIVAADGGGYRHAQRWGWEPDVVVGDFDSVGPEGFPDTVEQRHVPDQFSTDFEKALSGLPDLKEARLDVFGGLGGRADHQQTNMLVAAAVPSAWIVVLHGESEQFTRVTDTCSFSDTAEAGETISLLPFCTAQGVTASGLKWPLDSADMGIGRQLGQSNVALGGPVRVAVQSGLLWLWRSASP